MNAAPVAVTVDYYREAVRTWQDVNRKLKHFAECCAYVESWEIPNLAQDCGVSEKTVNNYREAYLLYLELGRNLEPVSKLWQSGHISLWVKAAQMKNQLQMTPEKTREYLGIAVENHMSCETFAAHVDEKENETPKWIRRLKSAIKTLLPSKDDYRSKMPPKAKERYEQWIEYSARELEAIAAMEE